MRMVGLEACDFRFAASLMVIHKAFAKSGKDDVLVTGHSLGGTQALFVNSRIGVKAVVFNPGASLPQAFEVLYRPQSMPCSRLAREGMVMFLLLELTTSRCYPTLKMLIIMKWVQRA